MFKILIKNTETIQYDDIDINKLSVVSNIVFKILMYDSLVDEIRNSFFYVEKTINIKQMKNLKRKFQLNVILFLIKTKPKLRLREINKFIQALAFNSYKLIYHLSSSYILEKKVDMAILEYSLRNNIELKVNIECEEKITQVFKENLYNEIYNNKKSFYASNPTLTINPLNNEHGNDYNLTLTTESTKKDINERISKICTRPRCD
ncbi:uncharacterized protein VNE69_06241 [Vairimorpha necatrix]|uniref:Uncharacterized protein n=1 Tax=Vairimorpha necatrix TaxID=6039 RepID=A0AAX4JDI9_9MICR